MNPGLGMIRIFFKADNTIKLTAFLPQRILQGTENWSGKKSGAALG